MRTSYSWHHKTDQKRKCNQSLHDMVVAPFLPRASRSLEGTVADLRKARGLCSSPGQHCDSFKDKDRKALRTLRAFEGKGLLESKAEATEIAFKPTE